MASTSTKRYRSKLGLESKCRICLTLSLHDMTLLESPLSKADDTDVMVLDALEIVVGENIFLGSEYPNGICGICLSLLNIAYDFKLTYYKSKQQLFDNSSKFIEEIETDENFLKQDENNITDEFDLISYNREYDHDYEGLGVSSKSEEIETHETEAEVIEPKSKQIVCKKLNESYLEFYVTETTKLNITEDVDNIIEIIEEDPTSEVSINFEESTESDQECAPIALITKDAEYYFEDVIAEKSTDVEVQDNVEKFLQADTELIDNISDDDQEIITKWQKTQETNFCSYCNRHFNNSNYLKRHRVVCVKFKNLECYVCNKKFKAKKNLINHITKTHLVGQNVTVGETKAVKFNCTVCDKVIFGKRKWTYHLETHKEKKIFCEKCGKAFRMKSMLDKHMQIHTKETKVVCPVCGKGFHYDSGLFYHMKVHNTKDRKYACSFCSKTFYNLCGKKRHERVHTGEKPYNCHYCSKGFRSRGERKTHEYLHSDERPFHCDICNIGYTKQYNLNNHLMTHPGDHKCHVCGKGFVNKTVAQHHFRLRHKGSISLDPLRKCAENVINDEDYESEQEMEQTQEVIQL